MENLNLVIDLHKDQQRQGPGGNRETKLAIELSGIKNHSGLKIADIGCGTGASALILAKELQASIIAVDIATEFLDKLHKKAIEHGVSDRIITMTSPMEELPFVENQLDVIWGEGSIYNMGFENGIKYWKNFLKEDGILAISEITWLTDERPQEIEDYWNTQYGEINTASRKMMVLEKNGFSPIGYFPLPDYCWKENYYNPLVSSFDDFIRRHTDIEAAAEIVKQERSEIELYHKFNKYFGYGFYIARK